MISTLLIRYKKITYFIELILSIKYIRLLVIDQNKIILSLKKIILIYKKLLNKFVT